MIPAHQKITTPGKPTKKAEEYFNILCNSAAKQQKDVFDLHKAGTG